MCVCVCVCGLKQKNCRNGQEIFPGFCSRTATQFFLARRREELLVSFFLGWASGGFLVRFSSPPLFIKCRFSPPPPLPPPFSLSQWRRRRRLSKENIFACINTDALWLLFLVLQLNLKIFLFFWLNERVTGAAIIVVVIIHIFSRTKIGVPENFFHFFEKTSLVSIIFVFSLLPFVRLQS